MPSGLQARNVLHPAHVDRHVDLAGCRELAGDALWRTLEFNRPLSVCFIDVSNTNVGLASVEQKRQVFTGAELLPLPPARSFAGDDHERGVMDGRRGTFAGGHAAAPRRRGTQFNDLTDMDIDWYDFGLASTAAAPGRGRRGRVAFHRSGRGAYDGVGGVGSGPAATRGSAHLAHHGGVGGARGAAARPHHPAAAQPSDMSEDDVLAAVLAASLLGQ